jgi:hypothetical protein
VKCEVRSQKNELASWRIGEFFLIIMNYELKL